MGTRRAGTELTLIGPPPDSLPVRGRDQLVTEIGMSDGNKHLGPFPGRTADQIDHALLRDNVVGLAAGVRYDIALEMGNDIGTALAILVNEEECMQIKALPPLAMAAPVT